MTAVDALPEPDRLPMPGPMLHGPDPVYGFRLKKWVDGFGERVYEWRGGTWRWPEDTWTSTVDGAAGHAAMMAETYYAGPQ